MSEDPKLDGTDKITPTPFDAHEQVVRSQHDYSKESGYTPAEPVALIQGEKAGIAKNEYPKAVDHVDKADAPEGHKEPVIATDEDHEEKLEDAK